MAAAAAAAAVPTSPPLRVTFYFDVGSPYSFLALEILLRYERRWRLALELRPVMLGRLLKAAGNASPAAVPAKGAHAALDLRRAAVVCAVPELAGGTPPNFMRLDTRPALALIAAAQQQQQRPQGRLGLPLALARAAFRQVFRARQAGDVAFDAPSLAAVCARAGLDAAAAAELMERARGDPAAAAAVAENTAAALAAGAFGAPTLIVHSERLPPDERLFFGSDRFEQMAALLGLRWEGPCPPERPRL